MLDLQIRQQIADYVAGDIEASQLEEWLSVATGDLENESSGTRRLAFDVLRLAAERGNGDWEDAELRERLGALSRIYWLEQAPKTVLSDSESLVISCDPQLAGTDRRRVAEYA